MEFIEFNPLLCLRQIAKQRPSYKKVIFYRTPCARRLRNLNEVQEYLLTTDSQLTIDLFCFDFNLHTDSEFVPIKVKMLHSVVGEAYSDDFVMVITFV